MYWFDTIVINAVKHYPIWVALDSGFWYSYVFAITDGPPAPAMTGG